MNQKDLTETFMTISNLKKSFDSDVFLQINSALCGLMVIIVLIVPTYTTADPMLASYCLQVSYYVISASHIA